MEGWFFLPICTAATAAGLTVMALCSEHWTRNHQGYAGLWTGCTFVQETQQWACGETRWPNGSSTYITAVKVLVIASVVLGLVTAVSSAMAYMNRSVKWSYWATVVVCLQDIILAIGLFTFLGYICKYGSRFDLSWSYSMGWISFGLYFLAIIFFKQQANRLRASNYYENINGI